MDKMILDIEQYEQEILEFCDKIKKISTQWDIVIGIGQGGILPAIYVARTLNKPLGVIIANRYKGDDKEGGKIKLSSLTMFPILKDYDRQMMRALVVDDIADRGITLRAVKEYLKNVFDGVDYAVVYYKPRSTFIPDIYHERIDNSTWVQFPHERKGEEE